MTGRKRGPSNCQVGWVISILYYHQQNMKTKLIGLTFKRKKQDSKGLEKGFIEVNLIFLFYSVDCHGTNCAVCSNISACISVTEWMVSPTIRTNTKFCKLLLKPKLKNSIVNLCPKYLTNTALFAVWSPKRAGQYAKKCLVIQKQGRRCVSWCSLGTIWNHLENLKLL